MARISLVFILSTLLLCATVHVGYAVTSEPEPPAGAPATSEAPPSSATEQHEGSSPGMGKKDPAHAKQESKERSAIKHTQEAITQGKAGNAAGLRKHAEAALQIAEGAEKSHAEAHVQEGIKHLKLAVDEAQKGNAPEGTKHAEEALARLKEK